jgi:nicotinamide-nucleotide amidase
MNSTNVALAAAVKARLEACNAKLVLAESCTAGQIAATLAAIPGVSGWLCGSFVVYRSDSKAKWLGIPERVLSDPKHGPVSALASELLANAVLEKTPEATWGMTITGDVGPGAPAATDGVCFVAIKIGRDTPVIQVRLDLKSAKPRDTFDILARIARLEEATGRALELLLEHSSDCELGSS